MDTITEKWCVRYVTPTDQRLAALDFVGSLEECVRLVEPKAHGSFAILPYVGE